MCPQRWGPFLRGLCLVGSHLPRAQTKLHVNAVPVPGKGAGRVEGVGRVPPRAPARPSSPAGLSGMAVTRRQVSEGRLRMAEAGRVGVGWESSDFRGRVRLELASGALCDAGAVPWRW